MAGRSSTQRPQRRWAASDEDSDDGAARISSRAQKEAPGPVAALPVATSGVRGGQAPVPRGQGSTVDEDPERAASEREAARVRKASRLLAHLSDEESDSSRSHPVHRQAASANPLPAPTVQQQPPAPAGGGAGSRAPPAAGAPVPAPLPGGSAKAANQASSLQRVRDLTAENENSTSVGFAQARSERVSSKVAQMLRHSSPAPEGSPESLLRVSAAKSVVSSDSDEDPSALKKHGPARRADKAHAEDSDGEDREDKPRRTTAAEVAEALRKKKKSQMAIADCLKQKAARIPVLRLLARKLAEVTGRLVRCPDHLSSRTSSILQGSIVFVGDDMTKVRPASALGAIAIVLVSGTDVPQGVDLGDIAGDVRVPVVAVSQAGQEQLTMGASTTLMFSNSIGSFSPEAKELVRKKNGSSSLEAKEILRKKNPLSLRKQFNAIRSGGVPVLASLASSIRVEETPATTEDSDNSPILPPRRRPVSQKKSEMSATGDRGLSTSHHMSDLQAHSLSPELRLHAEQPVKQVPLKPVWHALVDYEIKESFEVLDSPLKDATMASMFGMVEIAEDEHLDDAHEEISPRKTVFSAAPSEVDASAPIITADVVCVTPGLSVTNVYNELQAQSMHRGRTPADHRMPSGRHVDGSGSENMDPQTEEAFPRSPPLAFTLHTEPDATQHPAVNTADDAKSSSNKLQMSEVELDSATAQATHSHHVFFDQEPSAMAGFVARLISVTPEAQNKSLSVLYSGMLSKIGSKGLELRQDGLARLRELCRYKSSPFAQELVQSLFANSDVRGVLAKTLEPGAYDSIEHDRQQDAKLSAAACFRHLAIDPTMGRVLVGDVRIMGALGRSLNQEMVDAVRHTVAGCLANLSVQDDENRRIVCSYPEVLQGLQLMMENKQIADSDKHLETALAALSNLSMNSRGAGSILEHVHVETLVEAVQSKSIKSQMRAVRIIRNLARSREGRERLANARGVTDALNFMLGSAEPEAKSRAREALNVLQNKQLAPSAKVPTPKGQKRGGQGALVDSSDAATLQVCICEAHFKAEKAQAITHAFASLMIDVPGSAPKYSKTKRISPQNASFIWDETFTFKIERSDLSAAQLRISTRVDSADKTEVSDISPIVLAQIEDGIKADTWHEVRPRQQTSPTVTTMRVIVLLTETTECVTTHALGLTSPKFHRSFGPDGGLQNEADMSKISLQSGVGGRLLSPSIAFTPMVSRDAESKESKDAETKEQAESWENVKRPARNEGVSEETRNHPPHRSPEKHPVSARLAKLNEPAASWSSPSTREVRSPGAEAHGKDPTLVVPDAVIASSLSIGQPIAQDHINGEEQDSAEPGWMLPVDDEGKMLYSIDIVNNSVVEGGAKGRKVLHALAEQPGVLDALLRVMSKYAELPTGSKPGDKTAPDNLTKTMRLLRNLCRAEPKAAAFLTSNGSSIKTFLTLLRPSQPVSMDGDSAVEIRAMAAQLLALCAICPEQRPEATRTVQQILQDVRGKWWSASQGQN